MPKKSSTAPIRRHWSTSSKRTNPESRINEKTIMTDMMSREVQPLSVYLGALGMTGMTT